jgi:hypothetical protein
MSSRSLAISRSVAAALIGLVPLVGCDRNEPPPVAEGSSAAVEAVAPQVAELGPPSVVDEGSAAPTRPEFAATRPDALLPFVPADATQVALLDVAALRRVVGASVAELSDEDIAIAAAITALRRAVGDPPALQMVAWERVQAVAISSSPSGLVVAVAASAVDGAPAPGEFAGEGGRRIGRVGDVAVVGDAGAVEQALAGGLGGATGWAGWAQLAPDAAITWFAADVARMSPTIRPDLAFVEDGAAIGVSVGVDGEVRAVFDAADGQRTLIALGRGQAFANAAMGALRSEAHPSVEGWVAWLNAIERAVWSRLSVRSEGSQVVITFAGATCGGPLANIAALGVLSALVRAGAVDGAAPDIAFAPVQGAVADGCEPLGAPTARLPRSLAQIGDPNPENPGALALFDQASILRRGLPTAFGLLPFALSRDALVQAFGDGPFGFDDFATEEGSGAWHVGFGESGRLRHALVLHPGSAALVRGGPVFGLASARLDGAFTLFTPLVDIPARLEDGGESLWTDAAAHADPSSTLAIVVDSALLARLTRGGNRDNVVAEAVAASGWLLLDLGAPSGPRMVLEVADAASKLEQVREALVPLLMAVVDNSQRHGPLDQAIRTAIEAAIREGLAQMRFRAEGDVVEINAGPHPVATLGTIAVRVIFPVLGGSIRRGQVELPGGRNPWATP